MGCYIMDFEWNEGHELCNRDGDWPCRNNDAGMGRVTDGLLGTRQIGHFSFSQRGNMSVAECALKKKRKVRYSLKA